MANPDSHFHPLGQFSTQIDSQSEVGDIHRPARQHRTVRRDPCDNRAHTVNTPTTNVTSGFEHSRERIGSSAGLAAEGIMSEQFNPIHEPLVHEGDTAVSRLLELGIGRDRLDAALDAGDVAARQADLYSPVMAAGTLRWMETVRMLRQGLAADGWTPNDDRNSPRAVNPARTRAAIPVSGTADTVLANGTPRTANPRGKASSRAVQINGQLEFSVTALLADMAGEKGDGIETWYLLYYRDQNDELRAELSLPVSISEKGKIDTWRERIILPSRTFGAAQMVPRDAGGSDDVEFDIAAR